MIDKEYLSNVENSRLPIEEPYKNKGKHVTPHQVWRYASFIKGSPKEHNFDKVADNKEVSYIDYGGTKKPLITHYINCELLLKNAIKGTENCSYSKPELQNYFGSEFDSSLGQEPENSWAEEISLKANGVIQKLGYKIGDPIIDPESGIITFRNREAIKAIFEKYPGSTLLVSFYAYSGEKGFFGSETGESLPFSDKGPLLKKDQADTHLATFKVRGGEGNNNYILPPSNLGFDEIKGTGYYRKHLLEEFPNEARNTSTIVLEENLNDIIWENGNIDGGIYIRSKDTFRTENIRIE